MSESADNKLTAKRKIVLSLVIALIVAAVFFCGFFTQRLIMGENAANLSKVIRVIDDNYCYYDEETGAYVNFTAEDYAKIITSALDPYSRYYTESEYRDTVSTDKGNYFGFGAAFLNSETKPVIYKVYGNSPLYKSGVRSGDRVVAAKKDGGERVEFSLKRELMDFMSEIKENETVTFYVTRDGKFSDRAFEVSKKVYVESYVFYYDDTASLTFTSEGTNIPQKTVGDNDSGMEFAPDTAYIYLSQFSGNAANEFATAMNYMKTRGKTKLILDLRDNGGGFMNILSAISSYLVYGESQNALISYAVHKNGETESFYTAGDNFNRDITSIAVMANENTASASEALIGAMLYYGRAFDTTKLVIEKNSQGVARTYGKGIMQSTFQFLEGDAIKLTTAYVYQPDKTTCIQGKGIAVTGENAVEKAGALERAKAVL